MQLPASIPRSRALVLVLAAAAAAGCVVFSGSFDFFDAARIVPDLRPRRRALATPATKTMSELMPLREVVRYSHGGRSPLHPAGGGDAGDADGDDDESPALELWAEDIDYHQTGLCGKRKCFFLSKSDPSHGYLIEDAVVDDGGDREDRYAEAVRAYEYADALEREHGARHFSVAPPVRRKAGRFKKRLSGAYEDFYAGAERLVIQPSQTAPEGSIVMRCYNDSVLIKRLEYILRGMDGESKANLAEELEGQIEILGAHPELAPDFQLMIDPTGRIYHLDLDRVKPAERHWVNKIKPIKACLRRALEQVKFNIAKDEHKWEGVRCRFRPLCKRQN